MAIGFLNIYILVYTVYTRGSWECEEGAGGGMIEYILYMG
jgi:hypothetical protein